LRGAPRALLSNRISQYLVDVSYSIYIWHWPLIVLMPFVLDQTLFWPHKIILGLLSIALAGLTKRWVEDPVRRDPRLISNLRRTFVVGAVCIGLVLTGSAAVAVNLQRDAAASADRVAHGLLMQGECFGADATRTTSCDPAGERLLTTPLFAKDDRPDVYADNCWANWPFTAHRVCTYGPKDATTRIALIGNSHAGQWQPALDEAAGREKWRISTYLVSECYPADALISFSTPALTKNCHDWTSWAMGEIKRGGFDLVVMSNRTLQPLVGVSRADQRQRAKEAYGRTLKALTSGGTPVLVIRDIPGMTGNVPDCIAAHDQDMHACTRPLKEAIPRDPAADAARANDSGLATVVDVNTLLCPRRVCLSVIGGVIVFSDHGHLTKTFARTLAPEITSSVLKRLG
ncbi:MAG: acyltransferase, partial [Actinobacteria bacterium]|nr:acyltransferase [Actinomycetota bacterium]